MFKLSTLFRALLSVGILHMTPEDTSGGGGSATLPAGSGAPGLEGGGGGGSGGNEWDSVPKSWAVDSHAHWTGVSPEVRQIIHKREQDVERGIRTYADGHGRWSKLHGVFKEINDPNFKADELYEALGQNHLALARETDPARKRAMFTEMAKHYGVDFAQAAAGPQGGAAADELSPAAMAKISALIQPLVQRFQAMDQDSVRTRQEKATAEVDAFYRDPKNKYVKDAGPLMAQLLNTRQATNVKDAYELAILRTPELRAKYLADLAEAANGESAEVDLPAGPNLKSSAAPASPGKSKTIDATMQAVVQKHYGRVK